jgi:hypothetical protein
MYPYLVGIVFPEKSLTARNSPVLNSFICIVMGIMMGDKIHAGVSLGLKTLKSIVSGVLDLAQLLA